MASWIGTGGSNPGDVCTNGSVGIGTTSPSSKLNVKGDAAVDGTQWTTAGDTAAIYLGVGTNHYIRAIFGTGVQIGTYQVSNAITVRETTGNVGIGTASPGARLDVGGKVLISDSSNPMTPNVGAAVIYFDGTNLKVKRYDGKVATLSGSWS
jgi:hypothetical protein